MEFTATFIVLALLGIADAGYLTFKHQKKQPLACPMDHDCSVVTESKWGAVFGVRNELLGLLYYAAMLIGIVVVFFAPALTSPFYGLFVIASGCALLTSIFLVAIQFVALKDYCFYCLISAGLNGFLFINSLVLFLKP